MYLLYVLQANIVGLTDAICNCLQFGMSDVARLAADNCYRGPPHARGGKPPLTGGVGKG
jgi:hypothetical protein